MCPFSKANHINPAIPPRRHSKPHLFNLMSLTSKTKRCERLSISGTVKTTETAEDTVETIETAETTGIVETVPFENIGLEWAMI